MPGLPELLHGGSRKKEMRLLALFSSGKDSTYAIDWALRQGHEIACLLTALPMEGSMMFHHPNIKLAALSAEGMELPHQFFPVGEGEKDELEKLEEALSGFRGKIDGVVSGALASEYQKSRIDKICAKLGFESLAPFWRRDQEEILREMVGAGLEIVVVGVFADGLDESWLGRTIDSAAIDELVKINKKYRISIAGEGGEWESLVVDSPVHKKRIKIVSAEKKWERNSGVFEIGKAELETKN
jgi:diphthine-ammonia ligase